MVTVIAIDSLRHEGTRFKVKCCTWSGEEGARIELEPENLDLQKRLQELIQENQGNLPVYVGADGPEVRFP